MTIRTESSFCDEVESIRSFDVATIDRKTKKDHHYPNVENKIFQENRESFLDYISEKTVFSFKNTEDFFCN
jgi:transcription-repair coupling factor (superfamily II helicase)